MKRNLYKIMKKDSMFAPLNEEQKKSVIKKCDELMDLGIMHKDLPDHFDCVSIDMIKNLGIKSKRDTVLTPVQRKFCYEFVKDSNPLKSMERVRCDESLKDAYGVDSNGYYFLDLPKVKEKIKQLMERAEIDAEYILLGIKDTVERCSNVKPVKDKEGHTVMVETDDGQLAALCTFDAGNRLKGLEMLGKNIALWVDRTEITGKNGSAIESNSTINSKLDFSSLTEDQLKAIASVKINGE